MKNMEKDKITDNDLSLQIKIQMIDRQIFRDVLNYNHIMQDVIWFKATNKSREWKDGGGQPSPY